MPLEAPHAIRRIDQGGRPPTRVAMGAAVYNPLVLALYDAIVMGFANHHAWRCPTRTLLDWFEEHVSSNHLDVGVGTGYHLDRCRFPSANPRVVLADLNPNSLRKTARRIRRYRPRSYQLDVLRAFAIPEEPFDSISMNYLLHCLPGRIPVKAAAFDHLLPLLNPGGTLFGSTILGVGIDLTSVVRASLAFYNHVGVMNNAGDSLADLERCLQRRFSRVELRVVGSVALFSGRLA